VYPALAVARALRDARSDVELDYVGGVRGFERRIVAEDPMRAELRYHELVVRSLRSAGLSFHTIGDPARLAASVPQAWRLLGRLRPAALFTTGGYLALPLVLAARAHRIPTLVWEGNVQPGRATRAVGRYATRVAVSFPPTLAAFPDKGFVSGTPIRSFAGIDRDAARRAFGLGPDDRLLLVFGGSQAVTRLNGAVFTALPRLLADWHVLHLAGEAGLADAGAARQRLPVELRSHYAAEPYLTDRMADALVAADLVVGRAGSSTCAELTAAGVASILVPYPYAGAHQRYNARYLGDEGAARVVADEELDGDRLAAEVSALRDDSRRAAMADAARRLGRPDAARALALELLALAEHRPLPSETSA
jgi:UDP-N-acetylglucosamine--N-acetylmuramyl-(pentapeptide) pyrophosphoryl-undecaprenol N-acetylglucosamine transferase